MSPFAEHTTVSEDRTRAEIEKLLVAHGADQFLAGWTADEVQLGFRLEGRYIRYRLPMPSPSERRFTHMAGGYRERSENGAREAYQQAVRQRWRALLLIIKAKLEAVASGISTIEDEFLAQTITPSGETVSEWLQPQLAAAYQTGRMPGLLALPAPKGE